MSELQNSVPFDKLVEPNTIPANEGSRPVEMRISLEKIKATVDPEQKTKLQNFLRWILQQQVNQASYLVALLLTAISRGKEETVVEGIKAHIATTGESLSFLNQITSEGASRVAVASADILDKLKKEEPR